MLTRNQKIITMLWLGLPFLLLALLMVVNPAYTAGLFRPLGPVTGITLLLILQSVNAMLLLLGFQAANQRTTEKAKRGLSQQSRLGSLLAFITLIFLTLPALWLVLLYPSMMQLLTINQGF